MIALLQGTLVEVVSFIGSFGFNDARNLVDLTVESLDVYGCCHLSSLLNRLLVNEGRRHTELSSHSVQCHSFVAL